MKVLLKRAVITISVLAAVHTVWQAFPFQVGYRIPSSNVAHAAAPPTDPPNFSSPNNNPLTLGLPIFGNNKTLDNSANGGVIMTYLRDVLKLLSASIGAVIVLMLVIAGIQYITAFGNPKTIASAKDRVTNAIIALVLFLMTFAIISFLIPGGIVG